MRINKYVANATGLSRRTIDNLIKENKIKVNGSIALIGQEINDGDEVSVDEKKVRPNKDYLSIILNKPVGFISSRDGQGQKTVYELLPKDYATLKIVGRLDKNSSGLILLTNNGVLAYKLTHPKFKKVKKYFVEIDKPLTKEHEQKIINSKVILDGMPSNMYLSPKDSSGQLWLIEMHEGRNRQIRRTFEQLNYRVLALKRIQFDKYKLDNLKEGQYIKV